MPPSLELSSGDNFLVLSVLELFFLEETKSNEKLRNLNEGLSSIILGTLEM
jgi:hypothetical protein